MPGSGGGLELGSIRQHLSALKREDFEDKLSGVIKNVAEKLDYVKREDYENLQKRVKNLESELAKSKTKKTATAK